MFKFSQILLYDEFILQQNQIKIDLLLPVLVKQRENLLRVIFVNYINNYQIMYLEDCSTNQSQCSHIQYQLIDLMILNQNPLGALTQGESQKNDQRRKMTVNQITLKLYRLLAIKLGPNSGIQRLIMTQWLLVLINYDSKLSIINNYVAKAQFQESWINILQNFLVRLQEKKNQSQEQFIKFFVRWLFTYKEVSQEVIQIAYPYKNLNDSALQRLNSTKRFVQKQKVHNQERKELENKSKEKQNFLSFLKKKRQLESQIEYDQEESEQESRGVKIEKKNKKKHQIIDHELGFNFI